MENENQEFLNTQFPGKDGSDIHKPTYAQEQEELAYILQIPAPSSTPQSVEGIIKSCGIHSNDSGDVYDMELLAEKMNHLVGDKERIIQEYKKDLADQIESTRVVMVKNSQAQKEVERLKLERDKFEGGDQLKAKRIDQLEDAHSKNYDKLTELQSQLLQAQKEINKLKKGIVDSVKPHLEELLPAHVKAKHEQIEQLQKEVEYWKALYEWAKKYVPPKGCDDVAKFYKDSDFDQ